MAFMIGQMSGVVITVVVDKIAQTRLLIEASARFVIQVPTVAQLALTRESVTVASMRSRTSRRNRECRFLTCLNMICRSSKAAQLGWPAN
ncbi:hypothetical protein EV281_106353 [Rhizobium sp. BK418]|nr:hypothetical protein EV281_106353 [Rhizobium sp. BK418]